MSLVIPSASAHSSCKCCQRQVTRCTLHPCMQGKTAQEYAVNTLLMVHLTVQGMCDGSCVLLTLHGRASTHLALLCLTQATRTAACVTTAPQTAAECSLVTRC